MHQSLASSKARAALSLLAAAAILAVACTPTPRPSETTQRPSPTGPSPSTLVPTATPPASPSASPVPSPSVQPTIPPTTWEQVFVLDRGSLGSLATWRDGLIGAGCVRDSNGNCDQEIVVMSTDGQTWRVIEIDAPADVGFGTIDRAGGRLYALGYGHYGGYGGAVVWTSANGRDWSRVKSGSFLGRAVDDVIRTPLGTIAIGSNAPVDSDNITGFVTWPVSGDGSFGAMREPDVPSSFQLVAGAAWTGTELLAWAGRQGPYPSRITTLLSSGDGTSWSLRGQLRADRRSYVAQIISVGDRLVAVGYSGFRFPLTPQAWWSSDGGRTWKTAEVDGEDARMSSVQFEGSRLVARGRQSYGADELAVSWTSTDGRSWARLPGDQDLPAIPGFSGFSPLAIADRTCVAGTFYDDERTRAAIYCRPSS